MKPKSCSFCGYRSNETPILVEGPGVNICSHCALIAIRFMIDKTKAYPEMMEELKKELKELSDHLHHVGTEI
ncbi:hypothetical protein KC906_00795 [Candidatus Kaiserbacteria bacterium]|nr:hypothetical protein [Candidatus Kaiserbacteria bacterium]MCB9812624.1 hypothetical protein [Candidatus Nomurabacteria bacterium]